MPRVKEPTKEQLKAANADLAAQLEEKDKRTQALEEQLAEALASAAAAASGAQQPETERPRFPVPHGKIDNIKSGDILAYIQRSDPKFASLAAAEKAYQTAQLITRSYFKACRIEKTAQWREVKDTAKVLKLAQMVRKSCPYMDCFVDDWAIRFWAKQYMSNSRQEAKKKEKELQAALEGSASGDEEDRRPARKRKRGIDVPDIDDFDDDA